MENNRIIGSVGRYQVQEYDGSRYAVLDTKTNICLAVTASLVGAWETAEYWQERNK